MAANESYSAKTHLYFSCVIGMGACALFGVIFAGVSVFAWGYYPVMKSTIVLGVASFEVTYMIAYFFYGGKAQYSLRRYLICCCIGAGYVLLNTVPSEIYRTKLFTDATTDYQYGWPFEFYFRYGDSTAIMSYFALICDFIFLISNLFFALIFCNPLRESIAGGQSSGPGPSEARTRSPEQSAE